MNRSRIFLACFRKTGSVSKAAAAAKIDRAMHYRRLKKDAAYRAAFAEAQEVAVEVLEDEATRRAVEGVEEPVTYQGQFSWLPKVDEDGNVVLDVDGKPMRGKLVTIRKYSDSVLMFLLRGAKPEKYRERHQVEHTGTVTIVERLQAGRKRAAKKKNDDESGDD